MPDNKSDKVLATLASYAGLMIITTISLSWDLGGICFIVLAFTGAWHLLRRSPQLEWKTEHPRINKTPV